MSTTVASSAASTAGKVALSAASTTFNAASHVTNSAVNQVTSRVVKYETSTVLKLMRVLNIINGAGLITCGVLMLMAVPFCFGKAGCPGPATAILSFYVLFFGAMLFLYEARIGVKYESFFRRYFGFLFGQWGRFFYLLFLASLTIGVTNTSFDLWYVPALVGAYTLTNALLNCFIIRKHPGFQTGEAQEIIEQSRAPLSFQGTGDGAVPIHEAPITLSSPPRGGVGAGVANNGNGLSSPGSGLTGSAYGNAYRSQQYGGNTPPSATSGENPFSISNV
jgi:hypothetical protein